MEKVRGILAVGVVFLGSLAAWGADTVKDQNVAGDPKAANDLSRISPAERLVREALAAELSGDNARRDALLAQALQEDPNCRAARWQSGYVNLDGKWLTPEEAAQKYVADRSLAEYRRRRDQAVGSGLFSRGNDFKVTGDGVGSSSVQTSRNGALSAEAVAANAQLARWCRTKRLTDEERAHWTQVLLEEPANREAQSQLGMRWYRRRLLTNPQIDAFKTQRAQEETQLAEWKLIVSRWRKALDAGTTSERVAATDEMQGVNDPAIVPALEWADSSDTSKPPASRDAASPFQRAGVSLLGRLSSQRATWSLVQHAVFARSSELRSLAADELKKRPLHDFVPILLEGLANPVQFDYAVSFDRSAGLATYEAEVSQEGRDTERRTIYSNTTAGLLSSADYSRSRVNIDETITNFRHTVSQPFKYNSDVSTLSITPPAADPAGVAEAEARRGEVFSNDVARRNAAIDGMNRRIILVLDRVAGERTSSTQDSNDDDSGAFPDSADRRPSTSTADYWWRWWSEYNEVYVGPKSVVVTQVSNTSYAGASDGYANSQSTATGTVTLAPPSAHHSCFAAGTPVVTLTGPVAIEKLQIGDRVLAQNADTGELAFKPVLETSKSPPSKLLLVKTSRGIVRLTLGHPFWVERKGWRMAKELHVGDQIHCLDGIAAVTAIESQPADPVYNLNVADFGTYFVGDGHLFVHDFTPRLPTRALLPGYVMETH